MNLYYYIVTYQKPQHEFVARIPDKMELAGLTFAVNESVARENVDHEYPELKYRCSNELFEKKLIYIERTPSDKVCIEI